MSRSPQPSLPSASNVPSEGGNSIKSRKLAEEPSLPLSESIVKRTMGKLSFTVPSSLSKSEVTKSARRKRRSSLTKRGKDERTFRYEESERKLNSLDLASHDISHSPFIRPPSPEDSSSQSMRAALSDFGGTGSMHPGTQTLIQALQALPWTEEEPDDAGDSEGSTDTDNESSRRAVYRSTQVMGSRTASESTILRDIITSPSVFGGPPRVDIEVPLPENGIRGLNDAVLGDVMAGNGDLNISPSGRRTELARKLCEVFEMDGISQVVAGENTKVGIAAEKSSQNQTGFKDPYFPRGVVDLRYVGLKLRTRDRVISLLADSTPNRDEWMKTIQKVVFKAQNMGESVKIAIPYSLIVDVDKSSTTAFNELLEVKVIDKGVIYSVDSYYFAYFRDLPQAVEQIRGMVRQFQQSPDLNHLEIKDSTAIRASHLHEDQISSERLASNRGPSSRLYSLLKTFSTFNTSNVSEHSEHQATSSSMPAPSRSSIHHTDSDNQPKSNKSTAPADPSMVSESPNAISSLSSSHTYPPPPSPGAFPSGESRGSWSVPVPSWLKVPGRRVLDGINILNMLTSSDHVKEIYTAAPSEVTEDVNNMEFSLIESKEGIDSDISSKFYSSFALDEKESLLGVIPGYLFRALPVWGKFYISSSYLCFRSSKSLTKTRMMIPIRDILNSESAKGYRFGMFGLVVIIKGHEELFFEFGSASRRDSCAELLQKQLDQIHICQQKDEHHGSFIETKPESSFSDGLELPNPLVQFDTTPVTHSQNDPLPVAMFTSFTSTSSTFLTFKPSKPLHFTFLTIGSRGDVQPYIALGKRLLQEGHRVRIATHGEFQSWIESYGIEFAFVGGDPAELMRICVENGMFTVSFLKESAAKFRGWIDDLLKTSWDACQGTDVLIESPSAMGGIHIAEALKIPYFRAFTMPWSRTRAYPHAFAVPEHKMGGGYNYMTYVLFDQVFWRGTAGQINRWRRKTLKLRSTSLDKMEQHKVPFLYNFSPFIVPPPLDCLTLIRPVGYWFLDDADVSANKWIPPPELLRFIEKARTLGKKLVYVGFGSIVVSDPEGMTRCVVEAIETSGVHAILSKGWSDRLSSKKTHSEESEEQYPDVIFPIASIPHDWLFSKIDAACHHGGAGTTGASLRAGIPTIIKPFFGDQFFWGDRVEALGVGTSIRKLTVESLTIALVTATTDFRQISRAKLVGQTIRAEDGVGKAVEAIYRDLEYARSLIKRDDAVADICEDSKPLPSGLDTRRSSESVGPASEGWSVISEHMDRDRC
ncbi:hypothetical protein Clacol_003781 [Clathrus columnatus]|uniref:sterol 3beta-glucosyltransferase n=1 Tax=Clathrus columnatus TaxID=1419009 RepID=A0AAV5A7W5_9AGAM|nr:hypothetical protein Clacol_003781 [Clathrus columnatus]